MRKLKNLAFVLLLVQLSNEIVSCDEENPWDSYKLSFDLNEIYKTVNDVCASIDECKLECCQLNEMYFIANNRCSIDEINQQLEDVNWKIPFSETHKRSCKSVCSKNIINNTDIIKHDEDFQNFTDSEEFKDYLCDAFIQTCFNYVWETNHKINLFAMDSFRRVWLPVIGTALSISFMSVTLLLYLAIPELCRRVQDKCFILYLGFRIFDLIIYLIVIHAQAEENFTCKFYGFILQFSGLAEAFWLNITCFHLWRTIKSLVPPYESPAKTISRYSLYACGCPLLVSGITLLADIYLPEKYNSLRPSIGKESCAIRSYIEYKAPSFWLQPQFIYNLSLPIMIQIINFAAFLHVVYIISSKEMLFKRKKSEALRRHQKQKSGVFIYLKLFLLMGLENILDLLLFHIGRTATEKNILNYLSAFFLFLIFVCNKRVINSGKKRISKLTTTVSTTQLSRASGQCAFIMEPRRISKWSKMETARFS